MKSLRSEKQKILNIQNEILNNFENIITEILENTNKKKIAFHLILMFSGGPDSTILLTLAKKAKEEQEKKYDIYIDLHAIHLNHNIRIENNEAKRDEEFSKKIFEENNIKYMIYNENILEEAKKESKSIETYARERRYALVEEYIDSIDNSNNEDQEQIYVVLTGHNANDSAETIFMNILRGSGQKGIEGIKLVEKGNDVLNTFKKQNIYLAKPLKDTYKEDILKYLNFFEIKYMIDSTNLENEYFRNVIRNEIFPYIQEKTNFNILMGLNKVSANILEQNKFLKGIIDKKYNEVVKEENASKNTSENTNKNTDKQTIYINLNSINKQEDYLKKEIIKKALIELKLNKDVSRKNILEIQELIEKGINGKNIYPNKYCNVGIERKNNCKYLYIKKI